MKKISILLFAGLFVCCSCGQNLKDQLQIKVGTDTKIQSGQEFRLGVESQADTPIDSVRYYYAGKALKAADSSTYTIEAPLGKHSLEAAVFLDGQSTRISKELTLHSAAPPEIYTYEVVNSFPHDPGAFTQGLEIYRDTLYESVGKYGKSDVRKVDYKTGKVLQKTNLSNDYFAEGLSIVDDKLVLLTWRAGKAFVYDPQSLKRVNTFDYQKSEEGWGLCNDGEHLYKSDGTAKIWLLNPENLKEKSFIQPVTHKSLSTKLNELEWVKGEIYANTWHKDGVAIIDPKTGAIDGLIDFRGLKEKLDRPQRANVLNGIAYDAKNDRLFVTGKYWDKLFEVKIVEK